MNFTNSDDIEDALRSREVSLRDLYGIWEQRQPVPDPGSSKKPGVVQSAAPRIAWLQNKMTLGRLFTAKALEKEEFLLVCDAAQEALRLLPGANEDDQTELVRVRMNYAAALTRLGSSRKAQSVLERCVAQDFRPKLGRQLKVDILLQLGDTLREESHHTASPAERLRTAEEALGFYRQALEIEPDRLQALVSTAAGALIVGKGSPLSDEARDKAAHVLALVEKLEDSEGPRLQTTRARAVAHAVLGRTDAAAESYSQLRAMDGVTINYLADARYYSQFLAEALGKPRDFFKPAFPPLQLIVFAGHQPDIGDVLARFPPELIEPVREKLRKKLDELNAQVGLVSASAGADLLFIEALRARNGEVDIILPWARGEFRRTSVQPFDEALKTPLWAPLFDKAIEEAATVREIGQSYQAGSTVGWEYLAEVAAGIALLMARAKRLDVQPLALWDRRPGRGLGGTQSFVSLWGYQLQQEPVIIEMPPVDRKGRAQKVQYDPDDRCERSSMRQEVKSLLFADIVGYSKLTEHVIPEFVEVFLGRLSKLIASTKHPPRNVSTWGDALYAVFDFANDAGLFALEMTRMIQEGEEDWLKAGLYWEEHISGNQKPIKHPLKIRIGLHTGPVFMHYNPVVRQLGFTGSHVSRAARIEPVTKPDEVYASEEFSALAELGLEIERCAAGKGSPDSPDTAPSFVCEYAGSMQLAKGYPGRFRIYRVLPKRVLNIENLAKAAHELYCEKQHAQGKTSSTNPALRPWEELTEDLRDANRAQVADIPNKLRKLGYELAPNQGLPASEIKMTDAQVEEMAVREHDRWMNDRKRHGWTFASKRDDARKHHPLLVLWEALNEEERQKDRDTVRNLPFLIQKSGFRVRKIAQ
jgi:class 3 adenylate cyclase